MLAALHLGAAVAALLTGAYAKSTGQAFALATAGTASGVALAHLAAGAAGLALAVAGTVRAGPSRAAFLQALAFGLVAVLLAAQLGRPFWMPIAHAVAGLAVLALALSAAAAIYAPQAPCDRHHAAHRRFRQAAGALAVFTVAQVILGAAVRHLGAGLSIPDFPLAMGKLIPPLVSPYVAVHFAHRVVGMIVVTLAIVLQGFASVDLHEHVLLGRVARLLAAVVSLQVGLGAYVIWWERAPSVTVAHVANGGLALALALWLARGASPRTR